MRRAAITAAVAAMLLSVAQPVGAVAAPAQPPFTIGFPAPGAFVVGPPQVTVTGTIGPGVAGVEVNGQTATIAGSSWSIPTALAFGVNTFSLRAFDEFGQEVAHTSWSALYSPTYLPASGVVENAVASRLDVKAIAQLTPLAVDALTSSGALQTALASVPVPLPGHLRISQVTFDTPQVTATPLVGGFHLLADLPNLSLRASFAAGPLAVSARDALLEATLILTVTDGRFVASMPVRSEVRLSGFSGGTINPFARVPIGLVERALEAALQAALPAAVEKELNQATVPQTFSLGGIVATLETQPRSLSIDPTGATTLLDANITTAGPPLHPDAPGSISRNGATTDPPSFTGPQDVFLSVREDFLNRALFETWQAGLWNVTIDQAFLAGHGITLPFPLDSSVLVPFFPALQSLLPAGQPVPLSFELDPILPPVVTLSGAPSLFTLAYGELHLSILIDLGQGFQPLLTLAVHDELPASPTISNGLLQLTLGPPSQVQSAVLENPLGLSAPDIDRFLQSSLPLAVALAGSSIPPIPLPTALPFGLPQPESIHLFQDGPGGDFLTVAGNL